MISSGSNPKEEASLLSHQLSKEIRLDSDSDSDEMNEARQDLIDFVGKEYQHNEEQQLKSVEAFEQEYINETICCGSINPNPFSSKLSTNILFSSDIWLEF